jgi:hypothetical protein
VCECDVTCILSLTFGAPVFCSRDSGSCRQIDASLLFSPRLFKQTPTDTFSRMEVTIRRDGMRQGRRRICDHANHREDQTLGMSGSHCNLSHPLLVSLLWLWWSFCGSSASVNSNGKKDVRGDAGEG